jgi:hypothetical protein
MAAAARRGVPGGEGSACFAATEERTRRRRPNGALRAAKWSQLHARRARGASKRQRVARLGTAACVSAAHGDLRRWRPLRRATGPQRRRRGVRTPEPSVRCTWPTLSGCAHDALERGTTTSATQFNFAIQFSKLQNSKKCQLTLKSPKIKVVQEL